MQDSATPSSVPVVIPGLGVAISADTASAAACIPALPTAAPVPTPPDPPPEPKPKAPPFPRDTQLLQAMCAATARLRAHALPDTELVLTFADVLAGAAGSTEQQAALAMLQDTTNNTRPPTSSTGTVALVYVDDGGMAPSTAVASLHTLHNMTVTLRGTGTGTKRKVTTNEDTAVDAARKPKARGRKYGDCPGPMPAGWVLVRRDVDDPGRQYKRYRSPEGQLFSSYGQAQQHWEGLGQTVVDEVPAVELEPVVVLVSEASHAAVDEDGMLQTVDPGQRRYLPADFVLADGDPAASVGAGQDGRVLHVPTQTVYNSVRAAKAAARKQGVPLCYVPPECDWAMMHV